MTSPTGPGSTIVTLTMNPALDITTDTDRVIPTDKMRCGVPRYDPGGGGITVARIAHVLGESVLALFPAGGHAGDKVTDLVADSGVPVQRITVANSTRESFTVDEHRCRSGVAGQDVGRLDRVRWNLFVDAVEKTVHREVDLPA